MLDKVVLDANVFCKIFLQENDRQLAIDLVETLIEKNYTILAPNLLIYEVLAIKLRMFVGWNSVAYSTVLSEP